MSDVLTPDPVRWTIRNLSNRVLVRELKRLGACSAAVDWVGERDVRACVADCDNVWWVDWLVGCFEGAFGLPAKAEYEKVCAPAWAEYEKVCAPAKAEYEKVCAPAKAEYEKVRALAGAEYDRVRASGWGEYDRVRDPAWAEYEKVRALAWAEYEKACAPAKAAYDRVRDPAYANLVSFIRSCFEVVD